MDEPAKPPPKVFVSYRWTSPQHEEWVLRLATSLRSDGVDLILDKWHLNEGQDTLAFMEQMVSDPAMAKVLLICDQAYVERANSREGGVGTEAQIVSASVYKQTDQNKFAAVVTELDAEGRPYLPLYMSTRLYFDMSTDDAEAQNYDKILRWIFGKPFHAVPPIGEVPQFLETTYATGSSIVRTARRSSQSVSVTQVSSQASEILGMVAEESKSFIQNLTSKPNPEELALEGMRATFPVLENVNSAIRDLVKIGSDKEIEEIHSFFEALLKFWDFTPVNVAYTRIDTDAYQYFAHDAFVSFVAIAMQERNFGFVADVLSVPLFKPKSDGNTGEPVNYIEFRPYLQSLENRNRNLNLRRVSPHSDLLFEHHEHSRVPFNSFMEADLTLYIRSIIAPSLPWYPITSVHMAHTYGAFPSYARATSTKYYQKLQPLLLNVSADELRRLIAQAKPLRTDYRELSLPQLLNLERLSSSP